MLRSSAFAALLVSTMLSSVAMGADAVDTALQKPRLAGDAKRDAVDHPAEVLRLLDLKPGMQVADVLAGDGYYSEIVWNIVGPKGRVLMLNDPAFEKWSKKGVDERLARDRLKGVEHKVVEFKDMQLGAGTLDAVLLVKVYHDLYWVDDGGDWPKVDVPRVLSQIARSLKTGGLLLVVDHSAKPGTGSAAATPLHRIDEDFAVKDWAKYGLSVVSRSDVLRNASDARDQISYKPPAFGKTDRFVIVFRKEAK